jgi:hypothetical protein
MEKNLLTTSLERCIAFPPPPSTEKASSLIVTQHSCASGWPSPSQPYWPCPPPPPASTAAYLPWHTLRLRTFFIRPFQKLEWNPWEDERAQFFVRFYAYMLSYSKGFLMPVIQLYKYALWSSSKKMFMIKNTGPIQSTRIRCLILSNLQLLYLFAL